MKTLGRLSILVLLSAPLLVLFGELHLSQDLFNPFERSRLLDLLSQTFLFNVLTVAITIPIGMFLAVGLFRCTFPGVQICRFALLIGVFIPLPIYACAWQPTLGHQWPWGQGIVFAALVHALAGVPTVTWILGLGLKTVPKVNEEEALLALPAWNVFQRITLPGIRPFIWASVGWICLQTTSEITVTDMAQVRTFAEEVYTQFVAGTTEGLSRATSLSLMIQVPAMVVAGWICSAYLKQRKWNFTNQTCNSLTGKLAIFVPLILCGMILLWSVIPLWNLMVQAAGRRGDIDGTWNTFSYELSRGLSLNGQVLVESFIASMLVSACCIWVAIFLWQLGQKSTWFWRASLWTLIGSAFLPSPLLGFGLLKCILFGIDFEDTLLRSFTEYRPFRFVLYEASTPLPVMGAHFWRFLPTTAIFIWPMLARIPKSLLENAEQERASTWVQFRFLIWPSIRYGVFGTWLFISEMSLGEVSSGKIVQVPGQQSFIQELLNQMHYGVGSTVAAMALILWFVITGLLAIGILASRPAFKS